MAISFDCNLNPDSSNTRSLGSSSAKWLINGYVPEMITVTTTASENTSVTVSNTYITADHVVINDYMDIPADVSYTTSAGSVTFSCSSGIPAMTVYLAVKG